MDVKLQCPKCSIGAGSEMEWFEGEELDGNDGKNYWKMCCDLEEDTISMLPAM